MNSNTTPNDASPTNTTNINVHNPTTTPIKNNVVSQSQGSGGIEALIESTVLSSFTLFADVTNDTTTNSQLPFTRVFVEVSVGGGLECAFVRGANGQCIHGDELIYLILMRCAV